MHAETGTGRAAPGDKPPDAPPEIPHRQPIVAFFRRRAFFSKDTGRWHKLTGGGDHTTDERADDPGTGEPR